MKLARKLTLAILAVMVAVLSINTVERIDRDRTILRQDTRRDHRALGHALSVVVHESFREDGEARALSLVGAANERESGVGVTWWWLPEGVRTLHLDDAQRAALVRMEEVERVIEREGEQVLASYFPVRLEPGRLGVIEVAESLRAEGEAVRATIVRSIFSSISIALLAGVVTSLLGVWLVGRPVERLMEKARRVGAGVLTGPIELAQNDELAALAREMNAMCDRLADAAQARQHALEQLRHAERLATVGRLAAGIAHELGTPLNVITIEAKRVGVGRATGEAARESGGVITAQAARMAGIIRQLLDFARRRSLRPTEVELGELVRETLGLVGALATRQGVTLAHDAHGPAEARVDPGQLQQVLTNLLVNAVQAMPGGGQLRVETGQREADGRRYGYVRVRDQGPGIAPDALPRIFEPFFTTKDVGQGTGLGLAVAHGIVEEHGGRIEVESKPGEGSTFTVLLPAPGEKEVA